MSDPQESPKSECKELQTGRSKAPRGKKSLLIECYEQIPCNPCEAVCPVGAIEIAPSIIDIPALDMEKCTGCGLCVPACPGHAIFLFEELESENSGTVSFSYEFLPRPKVGDTVIATDRNGQTLTPARVKSVRLNAKYNRTAVVTLEVPKDLLRDVRGLKLRKE